MEKSDTAQLKIEELLNSYNILAGEGRFNIEQLEKAIGQIQTGISESGKDISVALNSNLNAFLHICQMLNESSFLKKDSDEVFTRGIEIVRTVRDRLRNLLNSKLQLKSEIVAMRDEQNCLQYLEYFVDEVERMETMLKSVGSKHVVGLKDLAMIECICARHLAMRKRLEAFKHSVGGQKVWADIELSQYLNNHKQVVEDRLQNILKKSCFQSEEEISEGSLILLEKSLTLNIRFDLETRIQEFFDNFIDYNDIANKFLTYEDVINEFVGSKENDKTFISKLIAHFTTNWFQQNITKLTVYPKQTFKILLKGTFKAFGELLSKDQEALKEDSQGRALSNLKLVHRLLNIDKLVLELLRITANDSQSGEGPNGLHASLANIHKIVTEESESELLSNIKQSFVLKLDSYFRVKVKDRIKEYESHFANLEKLMREEKKETPMKAALQKFQTAYKQTFEASLLNCLAALVNKEFLEEILLHKTIALLFHFYKRLANFFTGLARTLTLDEFLTILEYTAFIFNKGAEIIMSIFAEEHGLQLPSDLLEASKASLAATQELVYAELLGRFNSFEISNRTIQQLEAVKSNALAQNSIFSCKQSASPQ